MVLGFSAFEMRVSGFVGRSCSGGDGRGTMYTKPIRSVAHGAVWELEQTPSKPVSHSPGKQSRDRESLSRRMVRSPRCLVLIATKGLGWGLQIVGACLRNSWADGSRRITHHTTTFSYPKSIIARPRLKCIIPPSLQNYEMASILHIPAEVTYD